MRSKLRDLDLNLLKVFEAVYEERSQRKASERLNMSQPAVSNSLARLRCRYGDVLIYGARGASATPAGDELYRCLKQSLDIIRADLSSREVFEPTSSCRQFNIAVWDGYESPVEARIHNILRLKAPGTHFALHKLNAQSNISELLRDQAIDVAITPQIVKDSELSATPYYDYQFFIASRRMHPRIGEHSTKEEILRERFLNIRNVYCGVGTSEFIDFVNHARSSSALEISSPLAAPMILNETDLLAIIPSSCAKQTIETYSLDLLALPFKQPANHCFLVYQKSYGNNPAVDWIFKVCLEAAESFVSRQSNVPPAPTAVTHTLQQDTSHGQA